MVPSVWLSVQLSLDVLILLAFATPSQCVPLTPTLSLTLYPLCHIPLSLSHCLFPFFFYPLSSLSISFSFPFPDLRTTFLPFSLSFSLATSTLSRPHCHPPWLIPSIPSSLSDLFTPCHPSSLHPFSLPLYL